MKICQASLIMGEMKTPKSQMLLHARPMDKFLSLIPFIIFSPSFHFLFTQYSFHIFFIVYIVSVLSVTHAWLSLLH